MARDTTSPVLGDYLRELERSALALPKESRHDLRARVWKHCAQQVGRDGDEQRLAAALADLGSPDELVAGELARTGLRPDPFRPRDVLPIHLLGASLLTVGLGAVLGLALLWRSAVWPRGHKIVATGLVLAGTPVLLGIDALRPGWALWLGATVAGAALSALYLLAVRLLARGGRARATGEGPARIPPSEHADPPPTEGGMPPSADQTSDTSRGTGSPDPGAHVHEDKENR